MTTTLRGEKPTASTAASWRAGDEATGPTTAASTVSVEALDVKAQLRRELAEDGHRRDGEHGREQDGERGG